MGVGLLMALNSPTSRLPSIFAPTICALLLGLALIICIPEITLTLPRLAGLIR